MFDYAFERRATVFHVLLGAMFLAARETIPHTGDTRLPIGSVVDLREYAEDQGALPLCNLFGVLPVVIELGQADTLDQVIGQVREQFLATRDGHRQLSVPPFGPDSHPVVRQLWRCVPYRWIKASSQRCLKWRESAFLLLSDVGSLDPDRLDFGGPRVTEAFVASGMIHDPVLSLLCVSSFRHTLTICTGASHALPAEHLLDRTLAELPRESARRAQG